MKPIIEFKEIYSEEILRCFGLIPYWRTWTIKRKYGKHKAITIEVFDFNQKSLLDMLPKTNWYNEEAIKMYDKRIKETQEIIQEMINKSDFAKKENIEIKFKTK